MTTDQALRLLSSISKEEAMQMEEKIAKAEQRIRFRRKNPGKGYGRPRSVWKQRNPQTNK